MADSSVLSADHDALTVLRALIEMSRPDQLLLMGLLYATGVLVAGGRDTVEFVAVGASAPNLLPVVVGFLLFLPVAVSVHYANEYADYETDHLTTRTPFSGGSGALVRSGLPRRLALRAALAVLTLAVVAVGGVVTLASLGPTQFTAVAPDATALGLLALIAVLGWQYSLPPLALAWHGWGELDNALLGGVLLPTYGVAVAGEVTVASMLAFLPFGCVVFVNLLATTWPDREADAEVGKATLATRLSTGRLRWLYAGGLLASGVSMAVVHGGAVPAVVCWASLLAVPLLIWGLVTYTRRRSPFPTVAGMVVLAGSQFVGWVVAGVGV